MQISGTYIAYLVHCQRQVWLKYNGLETEQESETVALGRLLHEQAYERTNKDLMLEAVYAGIPLVGKLDGANLKDGVLYEVKKSKAAEESHIWQTRFYLWLLKLSGCSNYTGLIQYPLLKKTQPVTLSPEDEVRLGEMVHAIAALFQAPLPPDRNPNRKLCAKCSFEECCYG